MNTAFVPLQGQQAQHLIHEGRRAGSVFRNWQGWCWCLWNQPCRVAGVEADESTAREALLSALAQEG